MNATHPIPRILSIAGTDPTGGAGIHADLKAIQAAGGYGMGVVTAVVAQNTCGVRSIHFPPVEILRDQLDAVSSDVSIDAIKIGMLGTAEYIDAVAEWLTTVDAPVVVDPVMVATSGDRLLDPTAEKKMIELAAQATVVTPNIPELEVLAGQAINSPEAALALAERFSTTTGTLVVVKGGHLTGADAGNSLVGPEGVQVHVPTERITTKNTHGTGCSLSAALATKIAETGSVADALVWSTLWLHDAIRNADQLHVGTGNGPIDHGVRLRVSGATN